MKTVHLYLRRGPAGALLVVRHTFTGAPLPEVSRELVAIPDRAAWLAALVIDPDLKVVYNCHNSGATAPEGLPCHWFELAAGHPAERL
jgi:hypothetical protein